MGWGGVGFTVSPFRRVPDSPILSSLQRAVDRLANAHPTELSEVVKCQAVLRQSPLLLLVRRNGSHLLHSQSVFQ